MSRIYHLHEEVWRECGANAAILFHDIAYWISKNVANEVHYHEGKYWCYNSLKAFERQYPLTVKQVRTALDALLEKGYIIKGNFNNSKFDQTTWYALGKKVSEIDFYKRKQTDASLKINADAQKGKPIPNGIELLSNKSLSTDVDKSLLSNNGVVVDKDIAARAREEKEYFDSLALKFKSAQIKKEATCKSLRLFPDEYDRLVDEVLADWLVTETADTSWRHLLNCMRIKANTSREQIDDERINAEPIDKRRDAFVEGMRPFVDKFGREMCNAFFYHWTEPDKNGVMRFEKERSWNTFARLNAWARKERK